MDISLWVTLGVALAVLEIFVVSTYLLWMGVAAVITGVATTFYPELAFTHQLVLFSALSVVSVIAGKSFYKVTDTDNGLNKSSANK